MTRFVCDRDSYQVASGLEHPLVMNFANAIHPGGGLFPMARAYIQFFHHK